MIACPARTIAFSLQFHLFGGMIRFNNAFSPALLLAHGIVQCEGAFGNLFPYCCTIKERYPEDGPKTGV
jgi:hypothetical protein